MEVLLQPVDFLPMVPLVDVNKSMWVPLNLPTLKLGERVSFSPVSTERSQQTIEEVNESIRCLILLFSKGLLTSSWPCYFFFFFCGFGVGAMPEDAFFRRRRGAETEGGGEGGGEEAGKGGGKGRGRDHLRCILTRHNPGNVGVRNPMGRNSARPQHQNLNCWKTPLCRI